MGVNNNQGGFRPFTMAVTVPCSVVFRFVTEVYQDGRMMELLCLLDILALQCSSKGFHYFPLTVALKVQESQYADILISVQKFSTSTRLINVA